MGRSSRKSKNINPRRLNRRVELYAMGENPDGFGGYTPIESLVTETWAEVQNMGSAGMQRLKEYGLNELQYAVEITVRARPDFDYNALNYFLKFKGARYAVLSAENADAESRFITLYCKKETNAEAIPVAGTGGFPFTLD